MIAKKWDGYACQSVDLKPGIYVAYSDDMEAITTCPGCGNKVKFGETYTSKEYFFPSGVFGMNVCEECHRKEYKKFNEKI